MPKPIRLLVVDDSSIIRRAIVMMIDSVPDIEICGTAVDGVEALKMIEEKKPDVVTLDIEMPRKSGMEVLQELGPHPDTAILVLSSLTKENAAETFQALELGAADYLFKGDGNSTHIVQLEKELIEKVRAVGKHFRYRNALSASPTSPSATPLSANHASSATLKKPRRKPKIKKAGDTDRSGPVPELVLIGASTGGPAALVKIFENLGPCPHTAFLVVQHMPKMFTQMLAKRLGEMSGIPFSEASTGSRLHPNTGLIAPGGHDLLVRPGGRISIVESGSFSAHHPNITLAMESAAVSYADRALGILLTGMGRDGAKGLKRMRDAGCNTWAQEHSSCIVDGMPKAAIELDAVRHIYTPEEIAMHLKRLCGK